MSNQLYDFSSLPLHVSRYDGDKGEAVELDGFPFVVSFSLASLLWPMEDSASFSPYH